MLLGNKYRLFCYISKSRQGRPLVDIETYVELISSTTTKKGLTVRCEVDHKTCDLGIKPTEEQIATIDIEEWNASNTENGTTSSAREANRLFRYSS